MNFNLEVGMSILMNGRVAGLVEDLVTPEELPACLGWTGDDDVHQQLLDMCRKYSITRYAFIDVGEEEGKSLVIVEQQGRWRLINDGTFIYIEVAEPPKHVH